ncbi:hypothetical protein B5F54_06860 [Anaeromassilibacillus sp. An250]|nr:hypothetical protein B5F54_06860 [Anaeromassilibacillus sp. An250]
MGSWGRLHKEYLKTNRPVLYNALLLSGKLYTLLADLNEQASEWCSLIVRQMGQAVGITEEMKACEKIMDRLAEKRSKEDYDLVEELQDQVSIAQCEENECHFKVGFSAGLLVQQEAVEQVKKINNK